MCNIVILRAGAAYVCSWARDDFRPPLLYNLFSVVTQAHKYYKDPDPQIIDDLQHQTREKKFEFGAAEMRRWWNEKISSK
jgi:hypothetical protein